MEWLVTILCLVWALGIICLCCCLDKITEQLRRVANAMEKLKKDDDWT